MGPDDNKLSARKKDSELSDEDEEINEEEEYDSKKKK